MAIDLKRLFDNRIGGERGSGASYTSIFDAMFTAARGESHNVVYIVRSIKEVQHLRMYMHVIGEEVGVSVAQHGDTNTYQLRNEKQRIMLGAVSFMTNDMYEEYYRGRNAYRVIYDVY